LAVITDLLDVPDPVVVPDLLVSAVVTDLLVVLDQVVTEVVMVLPDVLVLVAVMAVQDQMVLKNLAEVVKVAGSKVQFLNKTVVPKPLLTVPITRNQQFSTNSRATTSTNLVLVVSVTSMIR